MPDYLALKAELLKPAYAGLLDADAAAALNAPDAGNPVPLAFTVGGLMAAVTTGSPPSPDAVALAKIYHTPAVQRFADDVARQDRAAVLNWLTLAMVAGDVSQAQFGAMAAVVNATGPGPSRSAALGWASDLTAAQVAHARSLG